LLALEEKELRNATEKKTVNESRSEGSNVHCGFSGLQGVPAKLLQHLKSDLLNDKTHPSGFVPTPKSGS
jgi:hypothetical protein